MAVEEAAESCGSHAAASAAGRRGGVWVGCVVASSSSAAAAAGAAAAAAAQQQQQQQRHKLEVYTEVLRRLHDSGVPEARREGFDDELWNHFNRLPARCVRERPPLLRRRESSAAVLVLLLMMMLRLLLRRPELIWGVGFWLVLQLRHGCERGEGGGRADA